MSRHFVSHGCADFGLAIAAIVQFLLLNYEEVGKGRDSVWRCHFRLVQETMRLLFANDLNEVLMRLRLFGKVSLVGDGVTGSHDR